jgi:hypothetical protein
MASRSTVLFYLQCLQSSHVYVKCTVQLFIVIDWPSTYTMVESLSSITESYLFLQWNVNWAWVFSLLSVYCVPQNCQWTDPNPELHAVQLHMHNNFFLNSDTNCRAQTSSMTWKDESHDSWSLIDYSGAWRKPFLLAPPQVSCQQSPLHFVLYTNSTNVVFKSYMYPFCWVGRRQLTWIYQSPNLY